MAARLLIGDVSLITVTIYSSLADFECPAQNPPLRNGLGYDDWRVSVEKRRGAFPQIG
jgi:hypothetical protein